MSLESERQAGGAAFVAERQATGRNITAERKATGVAMEANRHAIGHNISAERQASGTSMEAERRTTGKQITSDLNRLVVAPTPPTQLAVLEKRGALPQRVGMGTYNAKNAPSSGGGGIATPLTEADYTNREYWASGLLSSDGLFTMPAIKVLNMTDADGAPLVINLAQPITPPPVTP